VVADGNTEEDGQQTDEGGGEFVVKVDSIAGEGFAGEKEVVLNVVAKLKGGEVGGVFGFAEKVFGAFG